MDRYMLTSEGRARFRRMETRARSEPSALTDDHKILSYLYEHGATSLEELEDHTGLSYAVLVNKIFTLMNHGYIEELAG